MDLLGNGAIHGELGASMSWVFGVLLAATRKSLLPPLEEISLELVPSWELRKAMKCQSSYGSLSEEKAAGTWPKEAHGSL